MPISESRTVKSCVMILMKNKYKIEGTDAVEIEREFPQHFCSERAEKKPEKTVEKTA